MAMGLRCVLLLKAQPDKCGMRGFFQSQFVALRTAGICTPVRRAAGNNSAPFDSTTIVSSVGSPETDRGPPLS